MTFTIILAVTLAVTGLIVAGIAKMGSDYNEGK